MFDTQLQTYLWDLVHEEIETVLDRIKGEVGVTGITVPVQTGPIQQFRTRSQVAPRTFRSLGGVQFQPETSHYAGTRLRPVVADWLRKSNPLRTVAAFCGERALKLRVSLSGCQCQIMAEKFPAHAVKDVYGQTHAGWLCPVSPDVQEYLRALIEDLTAHHRVQEIELDAVWFPDGPAEDLPEPELFDSGFPGRALRALCFCESCRQLSKRDGLEIDAAAERVRQCLNRIHETGERSREQVSEFIAADPAVASYQHWRQGQVLQLLESLKRNCPVPLMVRQPPTSPISGADQRELVRFCDRLVLPYFVSADETMEVMVRDKAEIAGSPDRLELDIDLDDHLVPDAATLVKEVSLAAKLGVGGATLGNYGLLPPGRMDWVRQAVRYARRESNG